MDRRRHLRVAVRLRCRVLPTENGKFIADVETENISRRGVLLRWPLEGAAVSSPHRGDRLSVEIELPESQLFGRRCMFCQGTVVRVSISEKGQPLVGVEVERMQFRHLTPESRNAFAGDAAVSRLPT